MALELDYVGGSTWMETLRNNLDAIQAVINTLQKSVDEIKADIEALQEEPK